MQYRGLTLDTFQEQAIGVLDEGLSVLVAAPTGTGKTIIADWIVEQALAEGKQVIYTAPIKALSNQKFRDYTRLYGEDKVGLVTGDLVIRHEAPCRVMTTEVLRNMLLNGTELPDLKAVILDEIHFLDDRDRGTVWEEVLIYLPKGVQIVGLSATLSNLHDFARWLTHVRGHEVKVIKETKRAVPLTFQYASIDTGLVTPEEYDKAFKKKRHLIQDTRSSRGGRGRGGGGRGRGGGRGGGGRGRGGRGRGQSGRRPARRTFHTDMFHMVEQADLLPYLYFVFSRRDTELCARTLARELGKQTLVSPEESEQIEARLEAAADALGPALDPEFRALYAKGIAFHHAGLHVALKALVEELYEQKLIKVLYCTSTFALGINMPARTVVFDGLKKFDGRGFNHLTTRQFMQKAGRAGRRGLDEVGHVILRMDIAEYEENKPVLARYARQDVEPVRSSFNLSWNSVVSLLARHDKARIREIVDKSFLNWHLSKRAAEHLRLADKLANEDTSKRKEVKRLNKRARQAQGRCWSVFEEKTMFLQSIGYLDEDLQFNAGAKVLQHLQMAEIFVTELVLEGLFEDLTPPQWFGVACALTNSLPRHAHNNFRLRPEDRALSKRIRKVKNGFVLAQADELTGEESVYDEALIHLGRCWAEGDSLQDLLLMVISDTDISGDLITGFRRAKDLAGQLRDVFKEDTHTTEMLTRLIKTVSRDEVEVVG